jgi:hypothetical protein
MSKVCARKSCEASSLLVAAVLLLVLSGTNAQVRSFEEGTDDVVGGTGDATGATGMHLI